MEFMKHGSVKSKEDTQSEKPPKITKAEELKKKGYIFKESKGGGTPRIDKLNINDAVFQELKDNPILNKHHLTRLNSAKKKDQFLMDQNVLRGVGLRTPASNTRLKKGKQKNWKEVLSNLNNQIKTDLKNERQIDDFEVHQSFHIRKDL